MPKLYVYLKGGRGDAHICDDWNGEAPTLKGTVDSDGQPDDGEGIEAGDPYRDIFQSTTGQVNIGGYIGTPIFTSVAFSNGYIDEGVGVSNAGTTASIVESRLPDDVKHEKPRQFQKVRTWKVFISDTAVYEVEAALVIGYGSNPRR